MKQSDKKTFFEDEIILPSESGKGVKIGSFADREYAYGWHDITAPITVRGVAATDPSWARVEATNFWAYKFAVGDYVWQPFHVPHDIVPGTDIFFHAHHISPQTSPLDLGYVTWEFEWMYAKGFNQQAFDPEHAASPEVNSGIAYATSQIGPVSYQHMVTETAAVSIPDLTEPDGIICVRLGRAANQTSPLNEAVNDVFLLTADVHYQSTGIPTKQKAPNFYAL